MNSPHRIPGVKRGLGISLILASLVAPVFSANALAAPKAQSSKKQQAPTIDQTPYSGAGKYPVGVALSKVMPSVSAIYLNNNLSMDQMVSWNVKDGTVGDALNQMLHPLGFDWRINNNALTITEGAPYQPVSASVTPSERTELTFASQGAGSPKSTAGDTPVIAALEAPVQIWKLKQGETIRAELAKWASESGWALVWQLDKDWVIPADSVFTGTFDSASANVIQTLASNGVLIHANFYTANKTLVVTGPGVTPQ